MNPTSPFKTLDPSQKRGLLTLVKADGGAIWHRVGTGKTRIIYAWFAFIAKSLSPQLTPYFVVVCRREAFEDWHNEAVKMGLDWVVVDFQKYAGKNTTKKPRVFLVSHGMLHKLRHNIADWSAGIFAIAYDEGFLFKRTSTLHCKAANELSEVIGDAAIVSGSMMTAKNPEDIFGQLYAIGKHEVLARTLTDFRTKFMFKLHIGDPRTSNRYMYVKQARAMGEISKRIARVASVHFPKSTRMARDILQSIKPTALQWKYITLLREEYYLEVDGKSLDLKSTPALVIKCQQISDGFLVLKGKEKIDGPEIEKVVYFPSKKLEKLVQQVRELVECGERVVVWCAFKRSVEIVLQRLQKEGFKCYGKYGGKPFNSDGWRKDGQVAVATADSGSSFNHFEQCAYAIYYSQSWKWLSLQQSRGRTDRKSSRHGTCFYYYLHTEGSLDSMVYRTATGSGKKENELINLAQGVQQWLTTKPSQFALA